MIEQILTHPTTIIFIVSSLIAIAINYAIIKNTMATMLKNLEELQNDLKSTKEKHAELEKMLLREYLRKEDFIVFQNKVEARMEMKLEKLEETIGKLITQLRTNP